MSRSKLEDDLYQNMCLLARAEGSTFPLPVRELHPFWCCEHDKPEHGTALDGEDVPMSDVPLCKSCLAPYLECQPWDEARELAFHAYEKGRNWRCDFAWPEQRVILEVEGGVWTNGRHTRGSGFTKDLEKYNALTEAGWTVYRVSQREITSGEALNIISRAIKELP